MIKMTFAEVFKNTQYEQIQLWKTLIFDGNFYKVQEAQFCAWEIGCNLKVGVKTIKSELTELETAA